MDIQLADRLVSLRRKNGLSQEELADQIGVSRQAVSKWERGESSPDTNNLIALAKVYNLKIDDMLYEEDTNKAQKNQNNQEYTKSAKSWEDEKKKWKGLPYPIVAVVRLVFFNQGTF